MIHAQTKKITIMFASILLLTACASIDNVNEAAKLNAAGQVYKVCLTDALRTRNPDINVNCRSERIRLIQAVLADARPYDKMKFFEIYAESILELAKSEVELEYQPSSNRTGGR